MSQDVPVIEKYSVTGYFEDGTTLSEEAGNTVEEIFGYQDKSKLVYFDINDGTFAYGVDLFQRRFGVQGTWFELEYTQDGNIEPVR